MPGQILPMMTFQVTDAFLSSSHLNLITYIEGRYYLPPFYSSGNWGLERFINLPIVAQEIRKVSVMNPDLLICKA